jgi:hypothetical protein
MIVESSRYVWSDFEAESAPLMIRSLLAATRDADAKASAWSLDQLVNTQD